MTSPQPQQRPEETTVEPFLNEERMEMIMGWVGRVVSSITKTEAEEPTSPPTRSRRNSSRPQFPTFAMLMSLPNPPRVGDTQRFEVREHVVGESHVYESRTEHEFLDEFIEDNK
jgi:hypothetical protein